MEKPSKKLKKTILILGVTGAVYISFAYLLPLVLPFLVAYIFALILRPSAMWMEKRSHLPIGLVGGVEIVLVMTILGGLLYVGGRKLVMEAQLFFDNLPQMITNLDYFLTSNCFWLENLLHFPKGCLVQILRDMLRGSGKALKDAAMPFLMMNSMTIVKCFVQSTVVAVILFIATILSLQEMEDIRTRRENSVFRHEFSMLGNRLMTVGSAWLKTQASIMLLTMIICTLGLLFMGNPYSILLGIGIGLLDALPIFGTGTVLIPWALFWLITGNWIQGVGIFVIYIICYFLREIIEAKIMSDKVGLTPLETLISMYVGLQLFGVFGFILGPIGLLIIEDVVELYGENCTQRRNPS